MCNFLSFLIRLVRSFNFNRTGAVKMESNKFQNFVLFFAGFLKCNKNSREKVEWKSKVIMLVIGKHIVMFFLMVASKHTLNFHPSSLYVV